MPIRPMKKMAQMMFAMDRLFHSFQTKEDLLIEICKEHGSKGCIFQVVGVVYVGR